MRIRKYKYIRVIKFKSDKSSEVNYYKSDNFNPSFLVNPDHVFLWKGYRTIIITDKSAQTINPLDFESKYDVDKFKSAIESKLIRETFTNLKPKYDLTTFLLCGNLLGIVAIIYLLLKSMGKV